jgi:hypothetical protein
VCLIVALGNTGSLVVCLEADGRVALETASPGHCRKAFSNKIPSEGVQPVSWLEIEGCGSTAGMCRDIPLPSGISLHNPSSFQNGLSPFKKMLPSLSGTIVQPWGESLSEPACPQLSARGESAIETLSTIVLLI